MGQRIVKRPLLVPDIDTSAGQLFTRTLTAPVIEKKTDWDVYIDRLRNLIPAEVTAIYLAGISAIPMTERIPQVVWLGFCFVMTLLYTAHQSRRVPGAGRDSDPLPVAKRQVVIAAGSFLVWTYALGEPYRQLGVWVPYVSTLTMLAWTAIMPLVYAGEDPPTR